ncbi:hypothetical protein EDB65_102267 [Vibrio crassostreae]|uniref:hypothetical protein n=1 Tax=Vibrio crassostreae TaxID=246167 RepID=UPI0010524D11|nr:hypothetical protein [Vibrio crassostreae]TCN88480.1 hypothetical protein EDB65_102267 [Vibrio crassostreae]
MKFKINYFVIFVATILLLGCRHEGVDNNTNEADEVNIIANDVYRSIDNNNESFIDLLSNVESNKEGSYISKITPISSIPECQNYDTHDDGASYIVNDYVGLCVYEYSVSNKSDLSASASAYNIVAIQNRSTDIKYFSALSRVSIIGSGISFDLTDALGVEVPAGYDIDSDSVVVDRPGAEVTVDGSNIKFVASTEGIFRVFYNYKSTVDGKIIVGIVTVAASDGVNSLPSVNNFAYPTVLNVNAAPLSVDVAEYISDPDDDPLQLIYLNSATSDVKFVDLKDHNNTSFSFSADSAGTHWVSYGVTDHRGGYNVGMASFNVVDLSGKSSWDDVVIGLQTFYKPLTKDDAFAMGVDYSDLFWDKNPSDEKDVQMTTYKNSKAKALCESKGRLPTLADMEILAALGEDGVDTSSSWPVGVPYMIYDDSVYSTVDMSGKLPTSTPMPTYGGYVTCVADIGFFVNLSQSEVNNIAANLVAEAKVVIELQRNGVPLVNKTIAVDEITSTSAVVKPNESLKTDKNGKVSFFVTNSKAEVVDIVFAYEGNIISTSIEFIGDNKTAKLISLESSNTATAQKGEINIIEAKLVDDYLNPVTGQPVSFVDNSSYAMLDGVTASSDSEGVVRKPLEWISDDDFISTQEVSVTASTDGSISGHSVLNVNSLFYVGELTEFNAISNYVERISDAKFEAKVQLADGSVMSGLPVTFQSHGSNYKLEGGEKNETGWKVTVPTDSDGISTVRATWNGGETFSGIQTSELVAQLGGTIISKTLGFTNNMTCEGTEIKGYSNESKCFNIAPLPSGKFLIGPQPVEMIKQYSEASAGSVISEITNWRSLGKDEGKASWAGSYPKDNEYADPDDPVDYVTVDHFPLDFNGTLYVGYGERYQGHHYCSFLAKILAGGRDDWHMLDSEEADSIGDNLKYFPIYSNDGTWASGLFVTADVPTPTDGDKIGYGSNDISHTSTFFSHGADVVDSDYKTRGMYPMCISN